MYKNCIKRLLDIVLSFMAIVFLTIISQYRALSKRFLLVLIYNILLYIILLQNVIMPRFNKSH